MGELFTSRMDYVHLHRGHPMHRQMFDMFHSCQHHFDFVDHSIECWTELEELDCLVHRAVLSELFLRQPERILISCTVRFGVRIAIYLVWIFCLGNVGDKAFFFSVEVDENESGQDEYAQNACKKTVVLVNRSVDGVSVISLP